MAAEGVGATFPAGAVREAAVAPRSPTPQPAVNARGMGGSLRSAGGSCDPERPAVAPDRTALHRAGDLHQHSVGGGGHRDPTTLKLLVWDGAAWQPISDRVDTANKVVTGATTRLGTLALAGEGDGGLKLYLPSIRK